MVWEETALPTTCYVVQ